jgi:hypothetical protein
MVRYNPFNNRLSPERICGEVDTKVVESPVLEGFEEVYGPRPDQTSSLDPRELRRAKQRWDEYRENFGGLVTVDDIADPQNHVNPEALVNALKLQSITVEDFNELKMEGLRRGYIYYGIGEFKFFLTKMTYTDPATSVFTKEFVLRTYYPSIPGYFGSGVNTVKAPTIPVAQAQIELSNRGTCPENIISLLQGISLQACK